MVTQQSEYFAAQEAPNCTAVLQSKITYWLNMLEANGYMELLRMSWMAYHGAYYTDAAHGHQVTFSGEQGELANLPVNHFRNLAQHIIVMTTSNRPSLEARASNADYKSLVQTMLANGLLDYYMREKKLETYLRRAVEYAVIFGAGFIKMDWNATSGEIYDYHPDTGAPIYDGDVQFTNLSPFDVVYDGTKESQDHDWVLTRSFKNKFDVAAKYPELADRISGLPTKSEIYRYRLNLFQTIEETVDIPVYEFYHRPTESIPNGRYLLFLDTNMILYDGPMPYRVLPVFRMAPGDIIGTPWGYTPMFDVMPLQEAINALYSSILSNQNAFAVQNIILPRGTDISVTELVGGLHAIELDMSKGKPEALNLTNTPPEVFNFLETLIKEAETLSGVNSVARGNPEASLKSGAALALVQSMSLQFMSGLQQSYIELIESVGTALVQMLQDFANTPRLAYIVGESGKSFMKEFRGDDLSKVNRVVVDMGNPLSRTTAGRVQMAEQLLQMNLLKSPQDYFTVINTGRLDVATYDPQIELLNIQGENEKLINKGDVIALAVDDHKLHIMKHKAILADPDLRQDAQLVQRVLSHIQEHINLLRNTDPQFLMVMGQQPLPPPQPPGPPPGAQGPQAMNASPANLMAGPGGLPPMPAANKLAPLPKTLVPPNPGAPQPKVQGPGMASPVNLPNIPKPPAPFQNLPTNPAASGPPNK